MDALLHHHHVVAVVEFADHVDSIPTLATWFRAQWSHYYADWTQAEMEQDFLEDTSRDRLPCRLEFAPARPD